MILDLPKTYGSWERLRLAHPGSDLDDAQIYGKFMAFRVFLFVAGKKKKLGLPESKHSQQIAPESSFETQNKSTMFFSFKGWDTPP